MEIPEGLIEYSTATLECMAVELFRRRPRSALSLPIDLEFLIENEPNLELQIKDGLVQRHKVEGAVLKEEQSQNLVVWVDYFVYSGNWARYNAVLGEEFAHVQLHKALLLQVKSVDDFLDLQSHPEWDRYESDAKRFSRMFRMPASMFVAAAEGLYPRIVAEHGFADPLLVCNLLRNALAARFEASPDDALRRMLDAKCNIERRVLLSVQAISASLLPAEWTLCVKPSHQTMLFEN